MRRPYRTWALITVESYFLSLKLLKVLAIATPTRVARVVKLMGKRRAAKIKLKVTRADTAKHVGSLEQPRTALRIRVGPARSSRG